MVIINMNYNKLLIAVGANKKNPDGYHPIQTCQKAINIFKNNNIIVLKKSSWYISQALPKSNQPNYFNCVLECQTKLDAYIVLKLLNNIEKYFGRVRGRKNISRCIDLDIIDFSGRVKKSLKLTLPHPRTHKRKFVMLPIHEINPFWKHPLLKKNIKTILNSCNFQIIKRLDKKYIDFVN